MASSVVGNLIIRLAADTGTYEAGIRRAQRETDRRTKAMQKQYDKMARDMQRSMKAAAGATALVATAVTTMAVRTASAVRDTNALAKAIGVSTGTLQGWQYAGERVGISAEKMGDIFKDTSDKLGDFIATGGGEAKDLFENLNLDIEKLRKQKPDQQLLAIADAISRIEDPSQRVFYLESIADDASRLLPLLENNAAALKQYTAEAKQFGVAMSDVDVSAMLEADRVIKRLEGQFQGLANQIAIGATPAMEELGETFSDPNVQQGLSDLVSGMATLTGWAATLAGFVPKIAKGLAIIAADASPFPLEGRIQDAQARLENLQDQLNGKRSTFEMGSQGTPHTPNKAQADLIRAQIEEQKAQIKELKRQQLELMTSAGSAVSLPEIMVQNKPLPALTPPGDSGSGRDMGELRQDEIQRTIQAIRDQAEEYERAEQRRQNAVEQVTAALATDQEAAVAAFERRQTLIAENVQDENKRAELIARNWQRLVEDSQTATEEMSQFAIQAQRNIQNELGDSLESALGGNFDGILDSWGSMLRDMAAQAAAANILEAIGGFASEYGSQNGGMLGSFASFVGKSFAGARATGGPVESGKAYLVGEKGPELFAPGSNGSVIPNNAIAQPSSGGGDTYVNIQTAPGLEAVETRQARPGGGMDINFIIKAVENNFMRDLETRGKQSRGLKRTFPQLQHSGS